MIYYHYAVILLYERQSVVECDDCALFLRIPNEHIGNNESTTEQSICRVQRVIESQESSFIFFLMTLHIQTRTRLYTNRNRLSCKKIPSLPCFVERSVVLLIKSFVDRRRWSDVRDSACVRPTLLCLHGKLCS